MRIRPATENDCGAIAEITNAEIDAGVAHFATVHDDAESVAALWRHDHRVYPWFVAEPGLEGPPSILGFARSGRWKPRAAYNWTCEVAVYIHARARGRGVGRALYEALFPELERRGFRCVIAGVTVPNPPSERLHKAMGMHTVGVFRAVGFKHDAWRDVCYYALTLGDGSSPSHEPKEPDSTSAPDIKGAKHDQPPRHP